MSSIKKPLEMDDTSGVDSLLMKELLGGGLGDRIADAARMAMARDMLERAQQEMQSAAEAENSAQ